MPSYSQFSHSDTSLTHTLTHCCRLSTSQRTFSDRLTFLILLLYCPLPCTCTAMALDYISFKNFQPVVTLNRIYVETVNLRILFVRAPLARHAQCGCFFCVFLLFLQQVKDNKNIFLSFVPNMQPTRFAVYLLSWQAFGQASKQQTGRQAVAESSE